MLTRAAVMGVGVLLAATMLGAPHAHAGKRLNDGFVADIYTIAAR